jgi:hypothetical protein
VRERNAGAPIVGPALIEQNRPSHVVAPGLSPRTGRESRNVAWAFENANSAICARKKVGDVMLLPTVIFMMILWPVLLPALVTAFDVVPNRRRNSRRIGQSVIAHRVVGVAG